MILPYRKVLTLLNYSEKELANLQLLRPEKATFLWLFYCPKYLPITKPNNDIDAIVE